MPEVACGRGRRCTRTACYPAIQLPYVELSHCAPAPILIACCRVYLYAGGISELFPGATSLYATRGAAEHLSDADMTYLCRLTKLEVLHVPFSHRITLAGFAHVAALTSLRSLNLRCVRRNSATRLRFPPPPTFGTSKQQAYTTCPLLVPQHNRHTQHVHSW